MCRDTDEFDLVARYLPRHVELTRAEPGCLSFEVTAMDGSLIWMVEERFVDPAAFGAHQARVAASEWGRVTARIARDYRVSGLTD